jgi:hypothetical protein
MALTVVQFPHLFLFLPGSVDGGEVVSGVRVPRDDPPFQTEADDQLADVVYDEAFNLVAVAGQEDGDRLLNNLRV